MKQVILGTGLSGMVGSRIVELLSDQFEFEDLSYDSGIDITDKNAVEKKVKASKSQWILHLAAKTDVDGCEKDKENDLVTIRKNDTYTRARWDNAGSAWTVNVIGTTYIVDAASGYDKRVLYISTDFVFDGTKERYSEVDIPNPTNWYAVTKYEGEKMVGQRKENVVVRIAFPYRAQFRAKVDFVRALIAKFKDTQIIQAPDDNLFTPTCIDDIAYALRAIIANKAVGIYHVVGNTSLSSYEAAREIAKVCGYNPSLVQPTKSSVYYHNRAARPLKLGLANDKIRALGVRMHTFKEGLELIKQQIHN